MKLGGEQEELGRLGDARDERKDEICSIDLPDDFRIPHLRALTFHAAMVGRYRAPKTDSSLQ